MANKLEIWNRALHRVGELRISGLTENSVNRRILDDIYNDDRRALLELHTWKFARAHRNCAQNTTSPPNGYTNSFELPTDFIKIVSFNDTNPEYRERKSFSIVGNEIHTNEDYAKIIYIQDKTSEAIFPPLFVECLTLYLAKNIAYTRTKSSAMLERLDMMFDRALSRAVHSDAGQDITPPSALSSFPNLAARRGLRINSV